MSNDNYISILNQIKDKSKQDIHGGDVDSIADAMGRSRLEVMGWIQKHDLDESEA